MGILNELQINIQNQLKTKNWDKVDITNCKKTQQQSCLHEASVWKILLDISYNAIGTKRPQTHSHVHPN